MQDRLQTAKSSPNTWKQSLPEDAPAIQRIPFALDCTKSYSCTDDFAAQPAPAASALHFRHGCFGRGPSNAGGDSSNGRRRGVWACVFDGKHRSEERRVG